MPLSRSDVMKHLTDLGYHDISDDLLDVFVRGTVNFTVGEYVIIERDTILRGGSICRLTFLLSKTLKLLSKNYTIMN